VDFVSGASDSDSDSDTAADFGLFDVGVTANATLSGVDASAQANQRSGISEGALGPGTTGVSAIGNARSAADSSSTLQASSGASSDFSIRFTLPQPTVYNFLVSLSARPGLQTFALASFRLSGGADDEVIAAAQIIDLDYSDIRIGVLEAGDYLLEARAEGNSLFAGDASASFQVDLYLIPEPSTIVLVAAGLVGLQARSRRESRRPCKRMKPVASAWS
jgi:hypothetical protein